MMFHVYTSYAPSDPETARRHRVAQMTWPRQPWVDFPIKDTDLPRMWQERGKTFPYVKDLFDFACHDRPNSDILVFTNSDIMVRGDACARVAEALQIADACFSFRRDFHHRVETPIPDKDFEKGMDYPGHDLFAFRCGWWRDYREEMPDMIIGFEAWDAVLDVLIRETNPHGVPLKDIICHERHGSYWENPVHRYKLKSQQHNLGLARVFMVERGIDPRHFCIQ